MGWVGGESARRSHEQRRCRGCAGGALSGWRGWKEALGWIHVGQQGAGPTGLTGSGREKACDHFA